MCKQVTMDTGTSNVPQTVVEMGPLARFCQVSLGVVSYTAGVAVAGAFAYGLAVISSKIVVVAVFFLAFYGALTPAKNFFAQKLDDLSDALISRNFDVVNAFAPRASAAAAVREESTPLFEVRSSM